MKTLISKTICFLPMLIAFLNDVSAGVKDIGTPYIINYSKNEYAAAPQSWMIGISPEGLIYFANNDGLLEFDGINWQLHSIPSGTVLRSVIVDKDGLIYVGGFNEFGFFKKDETGRLQFHALQQLVPEISRDFGDVWKVHLLETGVVFQSYRQLMIYNGSKISIIPAPSQFHFSYLVDGELYLNDVNEGLFRLSPGRLVPLPGTGRLKGELIWAMLPEGDNILIATAEKGIYVYDGILLEGWNNPAGQFLVNNQVFCATPIGPSLFAFGTVQKGLLVCDASGTIYQQISLANGLQNNTILSMVLDQYDNLWLGLDNGIDYIKINSPLSHFSHFDGLSAGYAAILFNGNLYLGTNRGVFVKPWDELKGGSVDQQFRLVPNTQGQVWSLQVIDNELFCGHNSGTYIINDGRATKICEEQGGWMYLKPNNRDDILIGGTYFGLVVFRKTGNQWQYHHKVRGFKESSRFIVNGSGNELWMSHGYKGVFRITFDQDYDSALHIDFYNSKRGFKNDLGINVFEYQGSPVFTSNDGIYVYDIQTNSFRYSDKLNSLFNYRKINVLRTDEEENVWYFEDTHAGVLRKQDDGSFSDVNIPFRQLDNSFIKGFQFVYPINSQHVLLGSHDGFVHYSPGYQKNYNQDFKALIRQIKISKRDSVIYYGEITGYENNLEKIPFRYNDLQFKFTANDFENAGQLQFTTWLEGYDEEWTPWGDPTSREFTNMHHGDYCFRVKARNIFGAESAETKIRFEILPPWYYSFWAYLMYLVIIVVVLMTVFRYIKYRIELSEKREKERQERLFLEREKQLQNEALQAEKEVIRLRNEKLRNEMVQKDKELANATMQMIQKNKNLIRLRQDMLRLSHENNQDEQKQQVHGIMKRINHDIDNEKQWRVFETHFEGVHEEFLKRLKERFPELSPRELKLCAYLRLNISSKEIATLMNISTRGVEISRYRLRKKLNLDRDTNLTDFIMTF